MKKIYLWLLLVSSFATMKAQTTYYSKASATDFTAVSSWGTATDGTGTSPTSISNADNFVIQNASVMTLPANASVRQLTINSGSLTVAANTLTVSKAGAFDSTLTLSGGTLTVSGGNVVVNGNFNLTAGGKLTQSGGNISVDGNNAGAATGSVASGTFIVNFAPTANTDIDLSGGTFTIVDPHYTTTDTFQCSIPTAGATAATGTHTFRFGDGISTDNGGTNGFAFYSWNGTGIFKFKNVILETVTGGTNRFFLANGTYRNTVITGDLTINAGAEFRNAGTSSSTGASYFLGNIINNGTFTSLGGVAFADATSASSTSLTVSAATNAQTISGNGIFRNLTTSPTANFTSLIINNSSAGGVNFSNANSLLNGSNTGTVSGTLTFTNGIINTGSNTFVLGISGAAVGTLSYTAGGFGSGSTFSRWYGTAGSGTTIAASTVPAAGAGTYPFVTGNSGAYNANHFHRATAALTTAGQMAVKFNGATGTSSITPVTESSLTYDRQTNANWIVTTSAGYASSAAHTLAIQGQGTYIAASTNVAVLSNGALVGTAQAGTNQPMGQRTAVPAANIAATYTLATIAAEMPTESAQSGPWESTSTWVGGVVPSCVNAAVLSGHTVTVSASTTATPSNIIINAGGNLSVTGGSITVGCTNKNNYVNNNGTLSVSGGSLVVNGNINNATGSTFSQSAGAIVVDGNSGTVATSVLTGMPLVWFQSNNVNLTGGKLTIVAGHIGTAAADRAITYVPTTTPYPNITTGHTIQFGDGISTVANSTKGFETSLATRFYFGNVIVNTLSSANAFVASSSSTVVINGNLTVTAGEYRGGTTTQVVGGNIVNNGTLTNTGTLTFGQVTQTDMSSPTITPQTTAQSVSGSGVFRNLTASPTANFTSVTVNNSSSTGVTFADANSLLNGTNTGTVSGTLTLTTGFLNTGANTFVLGTSATSNGTLSYTAGGFSTGSTFARWWPTTTATGASITASTTTTATGAGVYPFATGTSTAFSARNMYLYQSAAATTGGKIAVQYNNVAGTNTVSIVDGAYTVDTQAKSNWVVSQSGITGTPTYSMAINGQDIYTAANGNSRITLASAPALGTHQAGTSYVNAQRTAIPLANLADTYYLGLSASDIPFISVANGNWNSGATWSKGTVPTCTDVVQIASGTTVTVNSAGNTSRNVTINAGGTLVNASGDLTVGCTLNNNFLANNGTLTVSGGTLNINGNIAVNSGGKFNQSGGQVNVDGNNAGSATGSVASGTYIVSFAPTANTDINLTGGTFTIVDPHYTTTETFRVTVPTAGAISATGTHTFKFGDGISTDNGGTNGFNFYSWAGTGIFKFKNVVLETVTGGSNRFFLVNGTYYNVVINGDLTINSGAEFRNAGTSTTTGASYFTGNIINNGTFTTSGGLSFADATSASSTSLTVSASTNAQTISGSGVFRNLTASPTANLTSLTVNNSNPAGVTLNVPLSVSGTLTLTQGFVNTTNTNLLTLGTATAAGTLSGGSTTAYIKGPFARTIGNANTSYILYPVGKTAYAPISLSPATTAVANMKAEAFDTNSGTASATIQNLSATRRWEAPLVSGTFTTINVRLGDNAITNANFPVIAPTASGIYDSLFGTTGTYAAGTPNTTQSTTALAAASYTGFLSYAEIAAALGTQEVASNDKEIKIYPNPFVDVLNISDINTIKSVSIVDISGRLVKTFDKPNSTLYLGELNSGMYLVVLNMKDGSKQTIKAIKR